MFEENNSTEYEKDTREITWNTNIYKFHCNHSRIKISIDYSASILHFFKLFCFENFINCSQTIIGVELMRVLIR